MSKDLNELLIDFSKSEGASDKSIRAVEENLSYSLPEDYKALLRETNGGEGFIGIEYLILWKVEELIPFNQDYEVKKYAPGLLMFASNGGGEGFAFDTRNETFNIVQVPFIGMSLEDANPVANSISHLLERMDQSDGSLF